MWESNTNGMIAVRLVLGPHTNWPGDCSGDGPETEPPLIINLKSIPSAKPPFNVEECFWEKVSEFVFLNTEGRVCKQERHPRIQRNYFKLIMKGLVVM